MQHAADEQSRYLGVHGDVEGQMFLHSFWQVHQVRDTLSIVFSSKPALYDCHAVLSQCPSLQQYPPSLQIETLKSLGTFSSQGFPANPFFMTVMPEDAMQCY